MSQSLAKCAAQSGEDVEVITSRLNKMSGLELRDNYKIKRVLGLRKSLYSGKVWEVILFIIHGCIYFLITLKRKKFNVTYTFFTLPGGILGLFIKKMYQIPYYVFLRGIDVPGFYGGNLSFLNKILQPIIKIIWINADKIIANSQALKDLAGKTLQDKPIYIFPNLVDTNFFHPKEKSKEDILRIVYVGRLNKQKGLDFLLESFAILSKNASAPCLLELVGNGPEKSNLVEKSAFLNISEKVVFLNWLDDNGLLERYQNADIFASASLDEGMPNAIIEAMACGLPIVATDIPAHRELIEDHKNGLLVPLKNPQGLAEALSILVKDKAARERMRDNNIEKIKNYSLQKFSTYFQSLKMQERNCCGAI